MAVYNARPELRAAVIEQHWLGYGPAAIGRILGITKSQVCGYLYRAGLTTPRELNWPTLGERLDALHAKLDAVLVECAPQPGHRFKWTRDLEEREAEASGD